MFTNLSEILIDSPVVAGTRFTFQSSQAIAKDLGGKRGRDSGDKPHLDAAQFQSSFLSVSRPMA